jgi:hypothetical protein
VWRCLGEERGEALEPLTRTDVVLLLSLSPLPVKLLLLQFGGNPLLLLRITSVKNWLGVRSGFFSIHTVDPQCCGSETGIRDGYIKIRIRDGYIKIQIRDEHPGSYFRELRNKFLG